MTEADVVVEAPDVSDLLREGEALSRARNYPDALDRFNRAIAMDPSSSMAWYNRGVLLEGQRDAKGAKQSFTICLDLDPDHAPATANLAVLLERMGETEGAGAMATRALTHYPDHPELLDIRRRCQTGNAIEPDLPVQRPTPTATWEDEHLTKAMDKAGVTDAQAVLEESTHHDTDGDGRLDEQELERAASVVAAQQQVQEAMVEQDAVSEPEPAPESRTVVAPEHNVAPLAELIEQAQAELEAGHPKAAIGLLRDRLRTDGAEDVEAWITAATAMHRLNLEDHALGAAQHSIRIDDERPEGWALVGDVHAAKGEISAAIDAYTNALERGAGDDVATRRWPLLTRSEHPALWFEEAVVRLGPDAAEDDRTALAAWMLDLGEGEVSALEHLPDQPPTLPEAPELGARVILLLADDAPRLRARAHSLQLQHLEAIGLWKEEVTRDNTDASAWTGMARALEAAGELEKAAKCHARAQQNQSADPDQMAPAESGVPSQGETLTTTLDVPPEQEFSTAADPVEQEHVDAAASLLLTSPAPPPAPAVEQQTPEVDLAAAALEATANIAAPTRTTTPEQDAQQGREWFNRGTQLLEDKKYREALSCFDKSLSLLADDEEKVILVLNARGNCYYYMEDYPKCVDAYYQAMMIRPAQVRGQTLYNMGVAYAEMERYDDAIKCFEQGESRGLAPDEIALAKEQIRRCKILRKEKEKRASKRR